MRGCFLADPGLLCAGHSFAPRHLPFSDPLEDLIPPDAGMICCLICGKPDPGKSISLPPARSKNLTEIIRDSMFMLKRFQRARAPDAPELLNEATRKEENGRMSSPFRNPNAVFEADTLGCTLKFGLSEKRENLEAAVRGATIL